MLYTFRGAEVIRDTLNELVRVEYAENHSAVIRRAICEAAEREGVKV